ncbi:MAG TPA: SDR family oxidoreductase [Dehalococcoidia bacterium]|nr:SDR family oxidoreductase [Dehalococcoidia bacterium]
MADRLNGRVAAVTGAGRGIGRAVALALAREGAAVVVNDYGVAVDGSSPQSGPAQDVVDEIRSTGGQAAANVDSVATVEGGESIVKAAVDNFGRLDILVNSAGILRDRDFPGMTEEDWDAVIAVHLKGHYCTCRPAAIQMRRQRYGRIVNFTSPSALLGAPSQANFAAAKAGVVGLTRVLARELGRNAITVNAIAPVAETRLTEGLAQAAAASGKTPQLGAPDQVAAMVAYLATEEAWNVNGKVFYVSGGSISLAYEEDMGRAINKDGMWGVEELAAVLPRSLLTGVANPAPPPPELPIPGRTAT